jgi:hypothetical protein
MAVGIDGGDRRLGAKHLQHAASDPFVLLPTQQPSGDAGLIGDHHHRPACLAGVMNQLPGTGAELHRGRITNVMAVFDDHPVTIKKHRRSWRRSRLCQQ